MIDTDKIIQMVRESRDSTVGLLLLMPPFEIPAEMYSICHDLVVAQDIFLDQAHTYKAEELRKQGFDVVELELSEEDRQMVPPLFNLRYEVYRETQEGRTRIKIDEDGFVKPDEPTKESEAPVF